MGKMGQRDLFRSDGNALKSDGGDACRTLQTHPEAPSWTLTVCEHEGTIVHTSVEPFFKVSNRISVG